MRSTRVDIEFTQGDDVAWLVRFVDADGAPVDMSAYTFGAWIKQWTGGPVLASLSHDEGELDQGRLLLGLTNQTSEVGHLECVWVVHITHVPSSVDWDMFSGRVFAREFATGTQTTELVVRVDDDQQVIEVVVGAVSGPPGPGLPPGTTGDEGRVPVWTGPGPQDYELGDAAGSSVEDQIVEGVIDKAPSEDAVFQALEGQTAQTATLVANHEDLTAPEAHVAFRFDQTVPAATWTVQHNLGTYPGVTVVIGGVEVDAEVTYVDSNQITVSFLAAHTGSVFLN